MTQEIKPIREFLKQWKERAYNFYMTTLKAYNDARKEIYKIQDSETYRERMSELYESVPKFVYRDLTGRSDEDTKEYLNKVLDREVESKYKIFINRINKIDGEVEDTTNLHIGINGEINGFIKCKTCNIEINTIHAGGYNIQCSHYRVLVKKLNKGEVN